MEVTSFPTSAAGSSPLTSPATDSPVMSSDFNTFIRMLTTQAKYQDPLNPIDSSQYASQLAQFSMVEQQVRTNDNLSLLSDQMSLTNMASLAGWVGMEVRAVTPMWYDGAPITVSPNPAAIADDVQLVVRNESGKEVQRLTIPVSAEPYEWTGVDDNGVKFPDGNYSFEVQSYVAGDVVLTDPGEVYGRVVEAQNQGGKVILVLDGGSKVLSNAVTALREAR